MFSLTKNLVFLKTYKKYEGLQCTVLSIRFEVSGYLGKAPTGEKYEKTILLSLAH